MATTKVNGKQKGSAFERKMCNKLSARFAEHTGVEKSFYRNPSSGAFFGGKNQSRMQTHDLEKATFGDIICPNNFKFSIECKHYKTAPSFKSILESKVGQWDTWISQAEQDASNANREVLLIIKYNNVEEFVLVKGEKSDLNYKGYRIVPLTDFIENENSYFFKSA